MSKRNNPRLHMVHGDKDPELFNADLDWYFGCFDAECGLKGIEHLSDEMVATGYRMTTKGNADGDLIPVKRAVYVRQDPIPYTDHHVTTRNNTKMREGVFTRGRRIWQRLSVIPYAQQQTLRRAYEPRRERPVIVEAELRAAHRAFLGRSEPTAKAEDAA